MPARITLPALAAKQKRRPESDYDLANIRWAQCSDYSYQTLKAFAVHNDIHVAPNTQGMCKALSDRIPALGNQKYLDEKAQEMVISLQAQLAAMEDSSTAKAKAMQSIIDECARVSAQLRQDNLSADSDRTHLSEEKAQLLKQIEALDRKLALAQQSERITQQDEAKYARLEKSCDAQRKDLESKLAESEGKIAEADLDLQLAQASARDATRQLHAMSMKLGERTEAFDELTAKLAKVQSQLDELRESGTTNVESSSKQISKLEAIAADLRAELAEKQRELDELTAAHAVLKQQHSDSLSALAASRLKNVDLEEQVSKLTAGSQAKSAQVEAMQLGLEKMERAISETQTSAGEREVELAELRILLAEKKALIESLSTANSEKESANEKLRVRLQEHTNQITRKEMELERLASDSRVHSEELARWQEDTKLLNARLEQSVAEKETFEANLNELNVELAGARLERDNFESKYELAKIDLKAKAAEAKSRGEDVERITNALDVLQKEYDQAERENDESVLGFHTAIHDLDARLTQEQRLIKEERSLHTKLKQMYKVMEKQQVELQRDYNEQETKLADYKQQAEELKHTIEQQEAGEDLAKDAAFNEQLKALDESMKMQRIVISQLEQDVLKEAAEEEYAHEDRKQDLEKDSADLESMKKKLQRQLDDISIKIAKRAGTRTDRNCDAPLPKIKVIPWVENPTSYTYIANRLSTLTANQVCSLAKHLGLESVSTAKKDLVAELAKYYYDSKQNVTFERE